MTEKKYRYSELFGGHGYIDEHNNLIPGTVQGEGEYTGVTSLWLRLHGCNLECNGFGQLDPTDPSSYHLPCQNIDVSKYNSMEELPVFSKGCDSSYSWSKKFMHLAHQETAKEIVNNLRQRLYKNKFTHEVTNQPCHMVFTGGEPILNQNALVDIFKEFVTQGEVPEYVTIETNGTIQLRDEFIDIVTEIRKYQPFELFWSVSPKIYATSGERPEKAIKPDVVGRYNALSNRGQLKFVCNGSKRSWDEIESAITQFRAAGVVFPVWIMPVGATIEGQELVAADIADQAIYRGYNVSVRAHVYLYGNALGR